MLRAPILAALLLLAGAAAAQDGAWTTFNGDLRAQKFSPLTEITPVNVGQLEVAWRTHTGDVWPRRTGPRPSHRHGPVPNPDTPPTVW
jgi:quinoprotein glucose dehydrogenase